MACLLIWLLFPYSFKNRKSLRRERHGCCWITTSFFSLFSFPHRDFFGGEARLQEANGGEKWRYDVLRSLPIASLGKGVWVVIDDDLTIA